MDENSKYGFNINSMAPTGSKVLTSNYEYLYIKLLNIYFDEDEDKYNVRIVHDISNDERSNNRTSSNLDIIKNIINSYCDIDYDNPYITKSYGKFTSLDDKTIIHFNCKFIDLIPIDNIEDKNLQLRYTNINNNIDGDFRINFESRCGFMLDPDYLVVSITEKNNINLK